MSTVRIIKRNNPFVQIDKKVFDDTRLSWKAKGLMGYLLSRPDDWKIYVADLKKRSTDGRDSVRTALLELIKYGYARKKRVQGEDGRFAGWEYEIFENPITENGFSEFGLTENGLSEFGESDTTNKEEEKKKKKKEKKVSKADLDFFAVEEKVKSYISKKYKNQQLLELLDGIEVTIPEFIDKVAKAWAGDGRSFDESRRGDQKGLDTSIRIWAQNLQSTTEQQASKFEVVESRTDQVFESWQKNCHRIVSENLKEALHAKIRSMMKAGITPDVFEKEFKKIRKIGASCWLDLSYTINNFDRLQKIRV